MKHEVTTYQTRRLMGDALKTLLAEKPFSKLTVSEVIRVCGVNRKTFYYHFRDLYDLLGWVLNEEAIGVVHGFDLLTDYEEAIRFSMDYVENNPYLANCLGDAAALMEMKRFFYADFLGIVLSVIETAEQEAGTRLEPAFRDYAARFYTEAIVAMLIDWAKNGRHADKEHTLGYLSRILSANMESLFCQLKKQ